MNEAMAKMGAEQDVVEDKLKKTMKENEDLKLTAEKQKKTETDLQKQIDTLKKTATVRYAILKTAG